MGADFGGRFKKESQNVFKLYATGGLRGCKGAQFTLNVCRMGVLQPPAV